MSGVLQALLAGNGGGVVAITDQVFEDNAASGQPASMTYSLTNYGTAEYVGIWLGSGVIEDWITPTTAASGAYEARVTINSGTLSAGTVGSWLALSSTRTWTVSRSGPDGTDNANFLVEIRIASSGLVLDSATIDLTATIGI